jgi:hypothetical protein
MPDTPACNDPGVDHTATTCLACHAPAHVGHYPICPASRPDATDLLVEHIAPDTTRTWLVSGLRHNLTPARRDRVHTQMGTMSWVRIVDTPSLPFSLGHLVNDVVAQMGLSRRVAALGYHPLAAVEVPDCACTDLWRCRCDFDTHPFRDAHPDFWPSFPLFALKVRYRSDWSLLWMLDNGTGAVWIAEDETPHRRFPPDRSAAAACSTAATPAPAQHAPATPPRPRARARATAHSHTRPEPETGRPQLPDHTLSHPHPLSEIHMSTDPTALSQPDCCGLPNGFHAITCPLALATKCDECGAPPGKPCAPYCSSLTVFDSLDEEDDHAAPSP